MKPSKAQQAKGQKLFEFFDGADDGYYESGKRRFEVNVKRHGDSYDLDKAIKLKMGEANIKAKFRKEIEKRLRERFTDERCYDIINSWLGWECECLHEQFTRKGLVQFDKGSVEAKRFEHVVPYGFAGRSGGHYLFDMNVSMDDLTDIAEGYDHRFSSKAAIDEALELYERMRKDALWLKDFVDQYNKGLKCQYEIEFRVEEEITAIMEEIQSELNHANKVKLAISIIDAQVKGEGEKEVIKSFIK